MKVFHSDVYLMRSRPQATYLKHDLQALRRGTGLGSVFASIFSNVVPFVKSALRLGSRAAKSSVGRQLTKHLKKSATEAGVAVVNDALRGRNVLQSSKEQVAKVANRMTKKVAKLQKAKLKQMAKSAKTSKKKKLKKARRGKKLTYGGRRKKKTKKRVYRSKKKTKKTRSSKRRSRSSKRLLTPSGSHTLRDIFSSSH